MRGDEKRIPWNQRIGNEKQRLRDGVRETFE